MIELKDFQQKAVDSLLTTFRKLSSRGEASVSIFKAPPRPKSDGNQARLI